MLQSLLQLLKGQPPDRIVWTADISYWIAGRKAAGQGNLAWDTEEGYLKLCRDLGILPYYWYANFWLGEPEFENVEILSGTQGSTRFQIWKTPVGEIRQESAFMQESCSEAITRHPVETLDDLKILLYILEHRRLKPANLDTYQSRMELWARYDGLPALALPRSPLPSFFYEWAGLQNAIYLMLDYPELVNEILDHMERQEAPVIDAVCRLTPPLVHFADNLSSENLSGLFDDYMRVRYRRRLDRLHEVGIKCAVHLDGTVKGLLPKLAAVGMDAVEALTPRPVGDVDVADQVPPNGDIEMVKKISELLSRRG